MRVATVCICCIVIALSSAYGGESHGSHPAGDAVRDITPMDLTTARVLKEKELLFSPLGYAHYGITDRLTLELDYYVVLGGHFLANAKYKLLDEGDRVPALAINVMMLYLTDDIKIEDVDDKFKIRRDGGSHSIDLCYTKTLSEQVSLSGHIGYTYSDYYEITGKKNTELRKRFVVPNLQIGMECLVNEKLSVIAHVDYGNSLLFFDQSLYKYQVVSGVAWSPWRWLVIEGGVMWAHFPEVSEDVIGPVGTVLCKWQF